MKFNKWILGIVTFLLLASCSNNSKLRDNPNFNHPESAPAIQNSEPGTTSKYAIYDTPPEIIERVAIAYPEYMKKISLEGELLLDVEVLFTGNVGEINVINSIIPGEGGLDEAAIEAIKQWRFKPAEYKGKPVSVRITFPVTFTLD